MFHWFSIFLCYSFLGFLLEVAHARLIERRDRGRKCLLFLPLCPVYGLGAVCILGMPWLLLQSPLAVFAAGGLLATLTEGAAGLFYRLGAGVRFWDYSHCPANLSGIICPRYTLLWGILALGLVFGVHPLLAPLLAGIPEGLTAALFCAFSADSLLSLCLLRATGTPESLRWYRAFRRPQRAM